MKIKVLFVLLAGIMYFGCGNGNDKNKIEASGTIEATNVTVSAKIGGEIKQLLRDEGQLVKAGDTVLTIDSEAYLYQLQQAEALTQVSEAQLSLLRNGARKEDIAEADAMLNQAEINLSQAKQDKERYEKLYQTKSITKKQYDDIVSRLDLVQEQYNSAKENFHKIKNYARPEELKQAEGKVNQSIANENLLRKNIRDSYVISPTNGFIVKKFIEKGETVAPMSSLFKVADLSTVELVIYVSEEELGKVKLGQKADVSVDAFKDKTFNGVVTYISPESEFTPKNIQTKDERTKLVFAVKLEISNSNFDLKPGMPADAVIVIR
jgi:HlyD family secretion protein